MTLTPMAPPLTARTHPAAALAVLALHLLLLAALWHTLARRVVEVRAPQRALTWVRPLRATPPPPPPPLPARPLPAEAHAPAPRATAPVPPAPPLSPSPSPGESTWVTPVPLAAAPAASAASAPPERLIDSAATRAALRQVGRQPLLAERAAEAAGLPIARTDTGLARGTAEAGKGDCLKGDSSGGLGILGLPLLAARAVTGDCAK